MGPKHQTDPSLQLLAPAKEVDLMGEVAMANAYNISHNVQDFMYFRGLRWPRMPKKAKKKKGKR